MQYAADGEDIEVPGGVEVHHESEQLSIQLTTGVPYSDASYWHTSRTRCRDWQRWTRHLCLVGYEPRGRIYFGCGLHWPEHAEQGSVRGPAVT